MQTIRTVIKLRTEYFDNTKNNINNNNHNKRIIEKKNIWYWKKAECDRNWNLIRLRNRTPRTKFDVVVVRFALC